MTDPDAPPGTTAVSPSEALSTLSESFVDVGCTVDSDGTIVGILCEPQSDSGAVTRRSLVGESVASGFHPRVGTRLQDALDTVLHTGDAETFEVTLRDTEQRRWYEVCVAPVTEDRDVALAMVRDVTEYERDRVRLERQQETIWEMLDALDDLVYVTDTDGRLEAWNEAVETTTGYDPATLEEMTPGAFVATEDQDRLETFASELAETGTVRGELTIESRTGETTPHEFVISQVDAPSGETHLIGISRNVTAQRRHREDLEQQREVTENIMASIDDIFYIFGPDGTLREWNDSLATVTGYTEAEIAGADPTRFFAPADHDRIVDGLTEAFETGHKRIEADLVTKTGEHIPYQFVANTFEMPDGEVVLCGIGRDVSARVEREQQIGVFGRVLRHNIRNAMTVVFGQTDYLAPRVPPALASNVDRIDRVAESLVDISEKGHAITSVLLNEQLQQRIRLETVLPPMVSEMRTKYPDASLSLTDLDSTDILAVPGLVRGLEELLENACEHNVAPAVTIIAEVREDVVVVTVADDGCGLPPNEANIITQSEPITPLFHGVGMGLWLVRWVVRRSGGVVDYRRSPDGGAQFDIWLERASE